MVETAKITLKSNVQKYGATLQINPTAPILDLTKPIVLDIETDQKDNFVGVGVMQLDSDIVYYFSDESQFKKLHLEKAPLIAHNAKFDLRVIRKWGIPITSKNIHLDTMIMSYVFNTTADSHALKDIARDHLKMFWDSYSNMTAFHTPAFKEYKATLEKEIIAFTGTKATLQAIKKKCKQLGEEYGPEHIMAKKWDAFKNEKCTLNFHALSSVANYCGCDVLATSRLVSFFLQKMTPEQRRILNTLEMPLYRIIFDMEDEGITIDEARLDKLLNEYSNKLTEHIGNLQHITNRGDLLFSSNQQVGEYLKEKGFKLPLTKTGKPSVKKAVLKQFEGDEFVDALLDYRKDFKMYNTFLLGIKKQPTLPKVHTTFNQVKQDEDSEEFGGISTSRLSSSNPNLQNIPKRSGGAKIVRSLFIPDPGHIMIVGDYSQIEYRLLAHFTKEPILLEAYQNGRDMHAEVGKLMAGHRSDLSAEEIRDLGKSLNFGTVYGAGPEKIASMVGCSSEEAKQFLDKYWETLPNVIDWKQNVIYDAKAKRGIKTFLGRFIPLPRINSLDLGERSHAERCAVNYVIQGSAAEVIKRAMIDCVNNGYLPRVQVHDELIFSIPDKAEKPGKLALKNIKQIMETTVKLSVPLTVDIHIGDNWNEAKG